MEEDDPVNFFHSLGLQTADHRGSSDDLTQTSRQTDAGFGGSSSISRPACSSLGELGLDEGSDARDPWSSSVHMASDMSFIDAIGLYWLNPANDKGEAWLQDSVQETNTEVSTSGPTSDGASRPEEKESEVDELDFLSVLGLTRVEHSGKKWRLWQPEEEEEEDLDWSSDPVLDYTQSSVNTDPTVVEDQAHLIVKKKESITTDSNTVQIDEQSDKQKPHGDCQVRNDEPQMELDRSRRVRRKPKKFLSQDEDMEYSDSRNQHLSISGDNLPEDKEDDDDVGGAAQFEPSVVQCKSCGAKVQNYQIAKHLISHFHYHRSIGNPNSDRLIIENIHGIVKQSPFQCQPCQFYCNWHKDLVSHVESHVTSGRENLQSAAFFCLICVRKLHGNNELCHHLHSEDHLELMSVINRSVPAIIQKISLVQCNLCDQNFRLNFALKRHMKFWHKVNDFELENHQKFQCVFCQYWSYKEVSLRSHMFLVHPKKNLKYKCKVCRKEFKKREHIKQHRNSGEHKENVFRLRNPEPLSKSCNLCNEDFLGLEPLKTHMKSQHLRMLPQCTLCGELFYYPQQLKGHIKSKCKSTSGIPRTESSHQCESCDFSSDSEWKLFRHRKIRHREKIDASTMVKCDQCFRKFVCSEQLDHHTKKFHKVEQIFKCHYESCSYITTKEKLFSLHIRRTHNKISEAHPCDQCDKVYECKYSLKNHKESVHLNGRSNVRGCDYPGCDFKYSFESDYARHKVKHTVDKSIVCNHCDFSCKRKSELTRHFRMKHTDSVPSKCDLCEYQTKNKSHLKRHIKLVHNASVTEPSVETFQNVAPENILVVRLDGMEEQIVL